MARGGNKRKKNDPAIQAHPEALKAYLDRIGAEVLSFRKAMVKERSKGDAYYIERTMVKIGSDGTIECSRKEHAPTKEEAEAIKAQFAAGIDFPKSIVATQAGFERFLSGVSGDKKRFYGLWDRKENGYRMVQERIETGSIEGKQFMPWSFWSDGEWRQMEPEGALSIWKPVKKEKGKHKIMIHEGCKTARFMTELVGDEERLAKFPWGRFVAEYEHWGMIGGALAPHRTDFDEVRRERPNEVVYVCDNDYPGESALQEVSRCYGGQLKGIKFGKHFPYGWDMADEFPAHLFTKGGRYIGPMLEELLEWATRATELVYSEKGRPVAQLRRAFKEEWIHSVRPEVYIHKDWPSRIWIPTEFNNWMAPFSDVDDTARLIRKDGSSKTAILKYDPGKDPGVYSNDEGRYINTHVGTKKTIPLERGDYGPFVAFMEMLVPEADDRKELMRWCATLIACPEIKMDYGVLLISETQGVGKSTLGEKILRPLMGVENVSAPSEEDICNSNFNYWVAHKRLAIVHEIYAGHSAKAYNKLKSIITDQVIQVNKKFQAAYEIDNWVHVFACSNSPRALQLSHDDRRWFVPKITEEKAPFKFWEELNDWLVSEGGLGKVKFWAQEFIKKEKPVLKGAAAPWTRTKGEIVEESYSPGMTLVAQLFDQLNAQLDKPVKERWAMRGGSPQDNGTRAKEIGEHVVVIDTDLVGLIKARIYDGRQSDRLEKPMTVRKVAKQKGWHVLETKVSNIPGWGCVGGSARALVRDEKLLNRTPGQLVEKGIKPVDIFEFLQV